MKREKIALSKVDQKAGGVRVFIKRYGLAAGFDRD